MNRPPAHPAARNERMQMIEARLNAALAPLHLVIEDDSAKHAGHAGAAEGGHYRVVVVSARFSGVNRVGRHRLVYDAVADAMQRGIHALAISAYTPEEFESLNLKR
jgi:BolA family transcriptional regulator, general stress-responsive regulator